MLSGTDIASTAVTTTASGVLDMTNGNKQLGSNALFEMVASASPTNTTTAVMAGVGAFIGLSYVIFKAGKFGYKLYQDHVTETVIKKMEWINSLVTKAMINKTVKLPLPFSITVDDSGKKKVDAIHFSAEALKLKGTRKPRQTSRALSKYEECISDGIDYSKAFENSLQGDHEKSKTADLMGEHGVIIHFIHWLIEIQDSYCLKFGGYDYDIEALEIVLAVISEYSSKDKSTHTRDFSRLSDVFTALSEAKEHLEIRREMRSLSEIIRDMCDDCGELSKEFLKALAMLVNEEKHREQITNITRRVLADGKIQRPYIKKVMKVLNVQGHEILIHESPFKNCLVQSAKYSTKVVDADITLQKQDIPRVSDLIITPNIKEYRRLEHTENLSSEEKKEKDKIHKKLIALEEFFGTCTSFITKMRHDEENKQPVYIPIKGSANYELMVERAGVIVNIFTIDIQLDTLRYYGNKLDKGLELLGEIYITSKENMKVFKRINQVFEKILETRKTLIADFRKIDEASKKAMDLFQEMGLRTMLEEAIKRTEKLVTNAKNLIADYWEKNKDMTQKLHEMAKDDLYSATDLIEDYFYLQTIREKKQPSSRRHSDGETPRTRLTNMFSPEIAAGHVKNSVVPLLPLTKIKFKPNEKSNVNSNTDIIAKSGSSKKFLPKALNKFRKSDKRKRASGSDLSVNDSAVSVSEVPEVTQSEMMLETSKTAVVDTTEAASTKLPDKLRTSSANISANPSANKLPRTKSVLRRPTSRKAPVPKEEDNSPEVQEIKKDINYLERLIAIKSAMNRVSDTLTGLKKIPDFKINPYLTFYNVLNAEYKSIEDMIREPNKTNERREKLDNLLNLMIDVSASAETFFAKNDVEHLHLLHEKITNSKYTLFIDRHKDTWKQRFFYTQSRKNVNNLYAACAKIERVLPVGEIEGVKAKM
jgi:hypothetical protein